MSIEQESKPEFEDINYLQDQLEKIHPDVYRNVDKETLTNSLEKATTVEEKFFKTALQESLSLIGDSHTNVPGLLNEGYLPISTVEISGDFYIIGANDEYKHLIGQKVKGLNQFSIETITEKISLLSSKENREVLLKDLAWNILSIRALEYYGFTEDGIYSLETDKENIDLVFDKHSKVRDKKPLEWKEDQLKNPTFFGNKIYRFRTEEETLIFQYNSCTNEDHTKKELRDFKKKLLKEAISVRNIVIDLRQNSGGDTGVMSDLLDKLPTDIQLYVAASRRTYSSGMHHLLFLKKKKGATLIGENAGQRPNRFGYVKTIKLPNSQIQVQCSCRYFELIKGGDNIEIIEPDIRIPVTINNYIEETDPMNQWIKDVL